MRFATSFKKSFQVGLLLVGLFALLPATATSQVVVAGPGDKLGWDPPSDVTDVSEYRLYLYGSSGGYDLSGTPTAIIPVGTNEWGAVITPDGNYFAVVTAADAAGNQSPPSNEINFSWDSVGPNEGPTNFRVIIRKTADGRWEIEVLDCPACAED